MARIVRHFWELVLSFAAVTALYAAAMAAGHMWAFWIFVPSAVVGALAPRAAKTLNELTNRYRGYPKLRSRLHAARQHIRTLEQDLEASEQDFRERTVAIEHDRAVARARNRAASSEARAARALYVELLKRALTHTLYWPLDIGMGGDHVRKAAALGALDARLTRAEGRDWPRFAQTMIGMRRLENVQRCVETVLREQVPGDLIEAGVWRGGTVIFMRGMLEAYCDRERLVFAADSFEGLPPPNPEAYPADEGSALHTKTQVAVSLPQVQRNFQLYDLLDDRVRFVKGWFKDTLPPLRDRTWSIVRLDGDMYESTMDSLVNLYPGLSVGGFLIIDDWALPACRAAVEDYRNANSITEPIEAIDWTGVFWRRAS